MTATCLAAALMIFTLYLLRSIAHGVHAWLTTCRGGLSSAIALCLLPSNHKHKSCSNACTFLPALDCTSTHLAALCSCYAGIFGSFFRLMLGWADIPDSFCEVALSFVLLIVTHTALRALAGLITEQLRDSGQLEPAVEKAVDTDGPDGTRCVYYC